MTRKERIEHLRNEAETARRAAEGLILRAECFEAQIHKEMAADILDQTAAEVNAALAQVPEAVNA